MPGCRPQLGVVTTLAGMQGQSGWVDAVGQAARFYQPTGLVVDSNGVVFVADRFNLRIRRITADGTVSTLAGSTFGFSDGTGAGAQFTYSLGNLALDGAGGLFVADGPRNQAGQSGRARRARWPAVPTPARRRPGVVGGVRRRESRGGDGDRPPHRRLRHPSSSGERSGDDDRRAPGAGGKSRRASRSCPLRFARPNLRCRRRHPGGRRPGRSQRDFRGDGQHMGDGHVRDFGRPSWNRKLYYPKAVARVVPGTTYVVDNNSVRRISSDGSIVTVAGQPDVSGSADGPGRDARFNSPGGFAVDPSGVIHVVDSYNQTIRRVDADGRVTTIAGSTGQYGLVDGTGSADARFTYPHSIVSDGAGGSRRRKLCDSPRHASGRGDDGGGRPLRPRRRAGRRRRVRRHLNIALGPNRPLVPCSTAARFARSPGRASS